MIIHMPLHLPKQPPEKEEGNKEYKRYLLCKNPSPKIQKDFIAKRASQMLYRLVEGRGKAVYMLGVNDNGSIYSLDKKLIEETIKYIKLIAKEINAYVNVVRIYKNNVCTVRLSLDKQKLIKIENLGLI